MTDDPHDAFNAVIRDGVWWCEKHNEDAETCPCGRGDPYDPFVYVVIGFVAIITLIVAALAVLW